MTGPQGASETLFRPSAPFCAPPGRLYVVQQATPFAEAWEIQLALHRHRACGRSEDTVLILEHLPVYTLGRRTERAHWGGHEELLRSNGTDLHRVNRGGSVTYHGPGQIVVYPIVRLTDHASGPKQFVRLLEEVVLRALNRWDIEGRRIDKRPGVWVDQTKIASIGIRVEHGVTLHGLALNVDMDLSPFHHIQPCGLSDCRMTSMAAVRGAPLELDAVKQELAALFTDVFGVRWPTVPVTALSPLTLSLSDHAGT